jgi:hypothetical protein
VPSPSGRIKNIRQAVSLDRGHFANVQEFVEHVRRVSQLKEDYEIAIDGFAIAGGDTVRMLQEGRVYR